MGYGEMRGEGMMDEGMGCERMGYEGMRGEAVRGEGMRGEGRVVRHRLEVQFLESVEEWRWECVPVVTAPSQVHCTRGPKQKVRGWEREEEARGRPEED